MQEKLKEIYQKSKEIIDLIKDKTDLKLSSVYILDSGILRLNLHFKTIINAMVLTIYNSLTMKL